MSTDRFTVLYHLIPTSIPSWVVANDDEIPPAGRILSFERETYQGSPFGEESHLWKLVWKQPNLSDKQVHELEIKYPKPKSPKELSPEMLARLSR